MLKIEVRPREDSITSQRRDIVDRVIECFEASVQNQRLLCFLDDQDPPDLKSRFGPANRGFYSPIHREVVVAEQSLAFMPKYVTDCIFPENVISPVAAAVAFDGLIYLYGSTSTNEIALAMTLAHELQHALQHASATKLWAVNTLVTQLKACTIDRLQLTFADIPIEREARTVSKRLAMRLFGEERVLHYIEKNIAERVSESDANDWIFVRGLSVSTPVNLGLETRKLLHRLSRCRTELEAVLEEAKSSDENTFRDIHLEDYF